MKILQELFIIFTITLLSDLLVRLTGLPLPGPVLGMILLLVLLLLRIIKPIQIESVGDFLLRNLAFLFLPLAVSTRANAAILGEYGWQLLVLLVTTTLLVMAVTGLTAQIMLKLSKKEALDE